MTPVDPAEAGIFEALTRATDAVTFTSAYRRHDDGSVMHVEVHSNGCATATASCG
ncbi:hypothetical protein [Actinoplanes auranticolor]|uniref:Uncharacterized protein n=1 Tax=Actinoplanes auranticolor TaxID=47988 RepID=A0A919VSJ9_9ACTN|nr:hypothetical protein [Actinoplanes auranticolor]GIM67897.1 hypothetical protein Aau02nite_29290 [Actinoplanes auranticolor]